MIRRSRERRVHYYKINGFVENFEFFLFTAVSSIKSVMVIIGEKRGGLLLIDQIQCPEMRFRFSLASFLSVGKRSNLRFPKFFRWMHT